MPLWRARNLVLFLILLIVTLVTFKGVLPTIERYRVNEQHQITQQAIAQLAMPPGAWALPSASFPTTYIVCGPNYQVTDTTVFSSRLPLEDIMRFYERAIGSDAWKITSQMSNYRSAQSKTDSLLNISIYVPNWPKSSEPIQVPTDDPIRDAMLLATERGEMPFYIQAQRNYSPLIAHACPPRYED